MDPLSSLPDEILLLVFAHLASDVRDVLNLSMVSRRLHAIAGDDAFWRWMCDLKRYPGRLWWRHDVSPPTGWAEWYRRMATRVKVFLLTRDKAPSKASRWTMVERRCTTEQLYRTAAVALSMPPHGIRLRIPNTTKAIKRGRRVSATLRANSRLVYEIAEECCPVRLCLGSSSSSPA